MRASFFILAAIASMVSAATIPVDNIDIAKPGIGDFPHCAVSCLLKAPRGNCGITDYHCLCHNDKFITESTECIEKACSQSDIEKALAAQEKNCKGK